MHISIRRNIIKGYCGYKLSRKVVILGDGTENDLGVLRSLRLENIPALVVSTNLRGCCIYSKYASFRIFPDPAYSPKKYIDALIHLAEERSGDILIPTSDTAVEVISKNKTLLEKYYSVPTPAWSVVENCLEKDKTYKIAEKIGISIPKTFRVEDIDHLMQLSKELPYPCIIKPSSPKMKRCFNLRARRKVIEVKRKADLIANCKRLLERQCHPLVQEMIPGPPTQLHGLATVLDFKSNPVAIFTSRKIRQIPFDFGVSTLKESLWIPEIVELGLPLLKKIGYVGISTIEFKLDPRDKQYRLMEINPRPWNNISLPTYCGINFPHILYKMVNGEATPSNIFKEGIIWHHLTSDLVLLLMQITEKNHLFSFLDYFKSFRGRRVFATFSLDDLAPFKQEIKNILTYVARIRTKRL